MLIRQRVLFNVWFGDNVGIRKGFIVYYVLYFMFDAEAIIGFVTEFFVLVEIFIEVPSRRYGIRYGYKDRKSVV